MKDIIKKIKELFKNTGSKIKNNFKNSFIPKLKVFLAKQRTKQVLSIIGIVLVAVGLIFGGIKLYDYSRTAYLKPYIEKYNIEYPEGILEEMCDAYGQDRTVCGKISIEDSNFTRNISSIINDKNVFLENSGDFNKEQHYRSIRLINKDADIEGLYSTAELFLKASQSVKITTLYNKEEYRVVAAFYTNTKPEDDNGYVFPYNYCGDMSKKDFEAYEDRIIHRTLYDTGYELSPDDYYLTVSEPSDFMEDFRFVIVCVKAGKKGFEKSTTATPNEKIHFPQVWYDANEENNPYIFAGKWHPKAV